MSFWANLKELLSPTNSNDKKSWQGEHFDFSNWNGESFLGTNNSVFTTNEEVFSVITRQANILASLPIHEYRKFEEQSSGIIDLLRTQPNPNMSGFELINQTEADRNVAGNGYIWIQRDVRTGTPIYLWPLNPSNVSIMRNIDDMSIWYDIQFGKKHFILPSTDVIHVKHLTPVGSLYGISPIDVLRGSLKFQKKVEDFSTSEMSKKDMFVLQYDKSVNDKQRQAIINDFRNMVENNGGAIVQQAGWKIDRYDTKFTPADLNTVEAISRTRIANAFNVPLSFLNDGQAKNTVNVEHVMTQFVINTLLPIVKQYEAEFNRKLLTQNQRARHYYFKFNVNGLMRGDTAARTQFYQMMIRNGIASQNDLRRLEDLPPVKEESADILWISKDLFPSENQMKASSNEAEAQPTDEKGGDTGDDTTSTDENPTSVPDGQAKGRNTIKGRNVY